MASLTYGAIYQRIIDEASLTGVNTYGDGTATTRLIKQAIYDAESVCQTNTEGYEKETTGNITTVANQNNYAFPTGVDKVKRAYVTIGTRRYYLDADRLLGNIAFDRLLNFPTVSSDIPQYWCIQNNQIQIFPRPATGGYTMTVTYTPMTTTIGVDPSSTSDQNTVCTIRQGFENILTFSGLETFYRQQERWDLAKNYEMKKDKLFAQYWNKLENPTTSQISKYGRGRFANPNLYPMNLTHT